MHRKGTCPSCGEPVSPFAAGCAICGADLEAARRRAAERRARRPSIALPQVRLPVVDDDVGLVALTALLVLLVPLFGGILAFIGLRDPRRANVHRWLLALLVAAFAITLIPALRFGVLQVVLGG